FEYANGGTMFLDEIGDLDITTQGKLLRVLESGEYQPIGSPETRYTDIRLLCATHRNLEDLVKQKLFREDLYYRLRGVEIRLPALRDRREDIPLLVEFYKDAETIAKDRPPKYIDPVALELLVNYDWPGNVRELEDAIKSIVLLTDSHLILASDVAYQLKLNMNSIPDPREDRFLARRVREFRRNCIVEALFETRNNISKAATILGVDRANLAKEIKQLGIPLD
ncbi:MAG: sigma 54-interacting transcriptional regulator, partial [Candidatus Zixiibacteriota bacterium]